MTNSSQSRSVLLTGLGKPGQLGETLLQTFAERGDTVYAVGRTLANVEALVAKVREAGGKAHPLAADLAEEAAVQKVVDEVSERTNGKLDVLVNAAGKFAPFGPVADSSLHTWQQTFANNATSAFLVTRGSLPMLRAAHGSIVYIGSLVGQGYPAAGMADYAASKGAVVHLMHAIADEEKGTVRANVIAPGGIKTAEMVASVGDQPGFVTMEEVAAKVLYFAGAESGDTTGEVALM